MARLAQNRRRGISLEEICEEFDVSHRTAQRMTEALETTFNNVISEDGDDRKRRWRITGNILDPLATRQETTLEALEIAARNAAEQGRTRHSQVLTDLQDELLARLTPKDASRSEADADAVLAGMGRIMRPGPKVALASGVFETVAEALKGPFQIKVRYGRAEKCDRILEPHGVLLGHRTYLVARDPKRPETILNFRMDLIREAECQETSFPMAEDFDLETYAARSFGIWQDPAQYRENVWRFAPEVADRAAEFIFHPDQSLTREPDGSLSVRFTAGGWNEMVWHLYQWGDKVEVLAPDEMREMVRGHQRDDFTGLP
ncbi:helix-turn-helix transcriptional regulator [Roseibium aestuarii]|uniref:Helix-turn-helix transcriptional regulator n=1 Tax=Roseibium aestuarii TaxID=2600299 RepID=A0ABW4JUY8_9HYPH